MAKKKKAATKKPATKKAPAAKKKPSTKKKPAAKRKASAKKKLAAKTKRKVNKSGVVRKYMAEHPDEGPTAVAAALKRYGVTVGLVSNVKSQMNGVGSKPKKKATKKRRDTDKRQPARATQSNGQEPLLVAAELIKLTGSLEEAQQALKTVNRVRVLLE